MKNNSNLTLLTKVKYFLACLMLLCLTACAVGGILDQDSYPAHTFSFDTMLDSPDVEVLDYQYSNDRHQGVRPERERVNLGQTFCCEGISGSILRGDFLYVKWRGKIHGTSLGTYEDKVDLRSRLPKDITGLTIHFVIRGPQLYVYLIWPGLKDASVPEGPIKMFRLRKQVQIYPDISK